jgi:signal transduction histidine kinase
MSLTADDLVRQYQGALRAYLDRRDEAALQRAYEMGRKAIGARLGVMDLAHAHQEAILALVAQGPTLAEGMKACRCAQQFFTESLWSFEMTQRGFREANRMLSELNAALEARARELAQANGALKREIRERKCVESALRESEENLRRLSRRVLEAQEQERTRISRELHDEVGQALTAINMNLALLRDAGAPRRFAAKVADLQKLLEQTMETIHNFTRELRPAMLDHLGLIPALRAYVRVFSKRTGLPVRFQAAPEAEGLGMEEKTVLYRVTQEGLTNVARHARAHRAAVLIRRGDRSIRMEIQDDGRAFNVESKMGPRKTRLGLLGIQERVRLVNGQFSIESQPGKGTTLRVEIPIKFSGAKSDSS